MVPRFQTGLHTSDWYQFPKPPYKGKGWEITFIRPRSEFPRGGEYVGNRIYRYKQIVISASNQVIAQRAANTIQNVRTVMQGSNLFSLLGSEPVRVCPLVTTPNPSDPITRRDLPEFHSSPNIPLACMIAARASLKLRFVYALARLALSIEILSAPTIELDPHHSPNVPKSLFPEDHIRMTVAITTAYSCIEELGLQIIASKENPSRINGAWNRIVKEELENRLRRAGIDLTDRFYWNLRGKPTRIERKRKPEIIEVATWARNNVRDGTLDIVDAIAYASFMRSDIAAHTKTDKAWIRILSIYDVTNIQFLARRLLLESLGFLRYFGERALVAKARK